MKRSVTFTIASLAALFREPKAYEVYDTKVPSLLVRVHPTGAKTLFLYKKVQGKPERIKIGKVGEISVENARKQAMHLLSQITQGNNPQDIKRQARSETTFGEFFEVYMNAWSKMRKKSFKFDQEQYDRHLKAPFGKKKLSDIRHADLVRFHADKANSSGKHSSNRILALMASVFTQAKRMGYLVGDNPASGLKMFVMPSRERFLQANEMQAFWDAVEAEPSLAIRDYIKMSLFTGARQSNVLAMQWKDIDFVGNVWRIPDTKSGTPLTVPLTAHAVSVLEGRKIVVGQSPFVFPSDSKTGYLVEPRRGWERVLKAAKIKDLRMHDLRRTFGSWMAINNVSTVVIGKALGNRSQKAVAVYARLTNDPVKAAMELGLGAMLEVAKQAPKAKP